MKVLIALVILLVALPAYAEQRVKFTWNANTDATTKYHLYMDKGTNPVLVVDGRETTTCEFTITDESKDHVFSLTAANATLESAQSDYLVWKAKPMTLNVIGTLEFIQ